MSSGSNGSSAYSQLYENVSMKTGFITKVYPIDSNENLSKTTIEYNVRVEDQSGSQTVSTVDYYHCIALNPLGSIADSLQASLRVNKSNPAVTDPADQNGAYVVIACINGNSQQGVILGQLLHPRTKKPLNGDKKQLAGVFNGVSINVEDDGSCSLVFNGPTDNDGNLIDKTIKPTTLKIAADGAFSITGGNFSTILSQVGDFTANFQGNVNLKAKKELNLSVSDGQTKASTSNGSLTLEVKDAILKASGSVKVNGQTSVLKFNSAELQTQTLTIKSSVTSIQGQVFLGGAGGLPALTAVSTFFGTDALGVPVISVAVSGYTTQVFVI